MRHLGVVFMVSAASLVSGCATSFEQGTASMNRGEYDTAASWYRRAVEEAPENVVALIDLGTAYNRGRHFTYAIPPLTRALQIAPNNPWAHFQLAYSLENLARLAGALSEYQTTVNLDPSCTHCSYAMANLYRQLGDLQDSLWLFDKYLAIAGAIPTERLFMRSALVMRNGVARDLAIATAEHQRELWLATQPPQPVQADTPGDSTPAPPALTIQTPNTADRDRAIGAIVEAFVGEAFRRDGQETGGFGGAVEQALGMGLRNDGIATGLRLAFPRLGDRARTMIMPLVVNVFEGNLSAKEMAEAEFRAFVVDQLKDQFQDQAQLIGIADFLWDVKLKARTPSQ